MSAKIVLFLLCCLILTKAVPKPQPKASPNPGPAPKASVKDVIGMFVPSATVIGGNYQDM